MKQESHSISFVRQFYDKTFPEAVSILLGRDGQGIIPIAKHSFHKNGTDRSLYVFEAPIDLLSHITLYPAGGLEHSYVACCGTSIQPVMERLRPEGKDWNDDLRAKHDKAKTPTA